MCLPEDLVEDILLRLAVEDLIRFKIVCKPWYSLISTLHFAKSHLVKQQQQHTTSCNKNDLGHVRVAIKLIPGPDVFVFNPWEVVGSVNGLVCLHFESWFRGRLLLVSNPWTRELRKLPMPQELWNYTSFSFGYDSSTDDYKLVMSTHKSETEETRFEVLSLRSNTWKLIGVFKFGIPFGRPGILFDGALHWLAVDFNASEPEKERVLLSFDLSREEFTTLIPHHVDPAHTVDSYVGIVEDQLCIFFHYNKDDDLPCNNIWLMTSRKGEPTWEKLPANYEMKCQVVHYMKTLEFTSSDNNRISFVCDDHNKCLSRSWRFIKAPLHVPSLISPYIGRPRHAKNTKTSVKSPRRLKGVGDGLLRLAKAFREFKGDTLCAEGVENNERE